MELSDLIFELVGKNNNKNEDYWQEEIIKKRLKVREDNEKRKNDLIIMQTKEQ